MKKSFWRTLFLDEEPLIEKSYVARTKTYLENEAQSLGLLLTGADTLSSLMDKVREARLPDRDVILEQFSPMGAKNCSTFFDYDLEAPWESVAMRKNIWQRENLVAEPKLDGVRVKAHLIEDGSYRFDLRHRNPVSYEYTEVTDNFPQFLQYPYPQELTGTILDGELLLPSLKSVLEASPEQAAAVQKKYGWGEFHAFDIVKVSGEWVTDKVWQERRLLLEKTLRSLRNPFVKSVPVFTDDEILRNELAFSGLQAITYTPSLEEKFLTLVRAGGEGLIFKDPIGTYEIGKRSWSWMKLERFESMDGFISGYIPGTDSLDGLVGALRVSTFMPNGEAFEFAVIGQMELDFRQAITDDNGTLRPEYYGRVLEIFGHEKNLHAAQPSRVTLYRWRFDKNAEECVVSG